jgi:hypothetical protein
LDVTSAAGTHLSTSLKDLQKLGVDAVNAHGFDSVTLELGSAGVLSATGLPLIGDNNLDNSLSLDERNALDVTLDLGANSAQSVESLQKALHDSGFDHFAIDTSNLNANGHYLDVLSLINNGLDLTLKVDTSKSLVAGVAHNNLSDIIDVIDGGLDLLSATHITAGETWGTLLQTLHDAGLGRIEVESSANLHIADDLSAALYESGMLHALPESHIEIDVAAGVKLLNTSLKAMADMGVDQVNAASNVYVDLGIKAADLTDMHDLFAAFGLDKADAPAHDLFAAKGAGLEMDKATATNLGFDGTTINHAVVDDLVAKLSKLGITQIDVVDPTAHTVADVYNITPQTTVHVDITVLGSDASAVAHIFDTDILHKQVK